jgi:chemotaxis protein methyltransferase CheR
MDEPQLEDIEIDLFLEAIYRRYGYDFCHYSRATIRRRVRNILRKFERSSATEMIPDLLHDEQLAQKVIHEFSITVTEMFRDPEFYRTVRQQVVPYLKTYPFLRAWVAGCATGEEVYSLAIVLHEEGIYDRTKIFATDFNETALAKAQDGIYLLKDLQQYTINYQRAGGLRSFSEYYLADYESAIIHQGLKSNLTFASHNLATDGVFGEVQLIFCRNVLIYFDRVLQNRVLGLLTDSLSRGGFLCLGTKETLDFSPVAEQYKVVNAEEKIYQKRVGG